MDESVIPSDIQKAFKILADPTRVRLLALLQREELSVQEIMGILGLAQSRVSSHLKILRESDLVADRRQGTYSFYRFQRRQGEAWDEAWNLVERCLTEDPQIQRDRKLLEQVLEQRAHRSRSYFDEVAPEWDSIRRIFNDDALRARAVSRLVPSGQKVVELGTGTGVLAMELARLGAQVIAVDHSSRMLEAARSKGGASGVSGIEWKEADACDLPLGDAEADAAFAHMALRYLPDPPRALGEMARVTRPGGTLVVIDFVENDAEWMAVEFGVQWLGFSRKDVVGWFHAAGVPDVHWDTFDSESADKNLPATFIASGKVFQK